MIRRIKIFIRIRNQFGLNEAVSFSLRWALGRSVKNVQSNYLTTDVFDISAEKTLNLLSKSEYGVDSPLVWFVPAWSNVWGGGHYTLFRFANLMSKNRRNIIYVYNNDGRYSSKFFSDSLAEPFPKNQLRVLIDPADIPKDAIVIATTWQSVYSVLQHKAESRYKFYFMQDFENLFYAYGSQSMQALASYQQGFIPITGGPWLLSKYYETSGNSDTGMNYMFTVDHDNFYPEVKPRDFIKRIFFYGRPSTERRCFELGIAALRLIKANFPDLEIVIAGLDGIGDVGFEVTMVGSVPLPQLGELYRSCDIGIALSGTNLSYLPVELMACGIPVITNEGPHVEWYCKNGLNSLVVPPFPTSIFAALKDLILDKQLYARLRKGGLSTSLESDWELESKKIFAFIENQISTS